MQRDNISGDCRNQSRRLRFNAFRVTTLFTGLRARLLTSASGSAARGHTTGNTLRRAPGDSRGSDLPRCDTAPASGIQYPVSNILYLTIDPPVNIIGKRFQPLFKTFGFNNIRFVGQYNKPAEKIFRLMREVKSHFGFIAHFSF